MKKHVCSAERTCFFDKAFPEGKVDAKRTDEGYVVKLSRSVLR